MSHSGWRRSQAAAAAGRRDGRRASRTVLAPFAAAHRMPLMGYQAMVEENEIRVGLESHFEAGAQSL